MSTRPCGEAQQNCDAPANLIGARTRGTCFYCGQPVCMQCSLRVWYGSYGRVRIGHDCLIELFGDRGAVQVYAHLYRQARYDNPQQLAERHVASMPDGIDFWRD